MVSVLMDFLAGLFSFGLGPIFGPLFVICLYVCCHRNNRRQDGQPLSLAGDNRRQVHPQLALHPLSLNHRQDGQPLSLAVDSRRQVHPQLALQPLSLNHRQDGQPLSLTVDNGYQVHPRLVVHPLSLDLPSNNGLDPAVIASLPVFVFKGEKDKSQNDGDEDCSVIECCVCLSILENEETARMLPNCKHVFHVICIDTWLASHSTCPICRTMVQPLIEPLSREGPIGRLPLPAAHNAPMVTMVVEPAAEEDTYDAGGVSIARLGSFRRMLSMETS